MGMKVENPRHLARWAFLRACAANAPEDWGTDLPWLRELDASAWAAVEKLAGRHGLTGLVARSLSWAEANHGIQVPVLERMNKARKAKLVQHLARRAAARRAGQSLVERGIPFAVFKGIVLAEEAYGDLSLRGFGDFDILVRPEDAEEACAAVSRLGYRLPMGVKILDLVESRCHAVIMPHQDGTVLDLHWTLPGELGAAKSQAIVWRECRDASKSSQLPGLRFSPEMTLILLASHYRHHAYEEFKPLVDFLKVVRAIRIDPGKLKSLAADLEALALVRLCAVLCNDLFGADDVLQSTHTVRQPARVRVARKWMGDDMLPYAEVKARFTVWLKCVIVNCAVGGALHTVRVLLFPSRGELVMLFKRSYALDMHARYYASRLHQVLTGCREHLTGMIRQASGGRR